ALNQWGGNVTNGFPVILSAPTGNIYYTLDGSDPRLRGGAISTAALPYSTSLNLNRSIHLKARVFDGSIWSGLIEATFYVVQNFTDLLLTEVMYHPPAATNLTSEDFEFIELKSVASTNLELSGLRFTNGISYTFPVGTFLAPGHFIVLVSNPTAFTNRYPSV